MGNEVMGKIYSIDKAEFEDLYRKYRKAYDKMDDETFEVFWTALTERERRILQEEIWAQTVWPDDEEPQVEFNF